MMFFPFGDKLQLFLVGKFLRSCIITRSRAAEKNKNLNSKKYEKKEKHRKTYLMFRYGIWFQFMKTFLELLQVWEEKVDFIHYMTETGKDTVIYV